MLTPNVVLLSREKKFGKAEKVGDQCDYPFSEFVLNISLTSAALAAAAEGKGQEGTRVGGE